MFINKIFAVGAIAALAAAIPLQQKEKRDTVWTTKVIEEVTTVEVTTTIWLNPGEATPKAKHVHHTRPQMTSHIQSTTTVPAAPAETPTQSPYVAPSSTSPAAPDTPAASPTTPATSEASPPPAASPTASPSPSGGSGSGSAPSGQSFTGDITYYTPGMGSCGITNTDSDMIVAMAHDIMEAAMATIAPDTNPNHNPLCGKSITISYGGTTKTATIEDTCPGCAHGSLDMTPSLFQQFAQESVGRVSGVEWWYNN